MQLNENTKKIEQIAKVSDKPEKITENISEVISKFSIKSNFSDIDVVKRCGIKASSIVKLLLILPFLGVSSVLEFITSGYHKSCEGEKDVYYGLKNNEKINWRSLLWSMAKSFRILLLSSDEELKSINNGTNQVKAIVFDDSVLEKTGKTIEGVGYVHDHCKDFHVLGYKILVCGFWDGASFIPLDFTIHKEKRDKELKKAAKRLAAKEGQLSRTLSEVGDVKKKIKHQRKVLYSLKCAYKNKRNKTNESKVEKRQSAIIRLDNKLSLLRVKVQKLTTERDHNHNTYSEIKLTYKRCGLTKSEQQRQYKKKRERNSSGYKRSKETGVNKIDSMIKMFKRAVRHGFIPDYILTDTWFFCGKLLSEVVRCSKNVNLVAMAPIGISKYRVLPKGKTMTPKEIITAYERKHAKNSRKYKSKYIELQAEYQGMRVKIFLIKFGRHSKWRMLVTTELNMSFIKIIEVYRIRWTIEVFFKECKQYLHLGKCQSQDFDAQIADATLALMRYILLSYYERIHYGMTIGGLFRELSQLSIKENLLADINIYFSELLKIFAEMAGVDFITFYEGLLRNKKVHELSDTFGIMFMNSEIRQSA